MSRKLSILPLLALIIMVSCVGGSGTSHADVAGDTIPTRYATNLTMVEHDGFTCVDFRNPWDTTKTLQTILLVPQNAELPSDMPQGIVIRTPLQRSIVYTSVHNSLIDELGSLDAVVGVCDSKYISNSAVKERLVQGTMVDCGQSTAPNIEQILQLRPDAILLSAYENSNDHNKVGQIGIPIIDCIDYMENSPLARAEWMRFFGRLYGRGAEADSLFNATEQAYLQIKQMAQNVDTHPVVLTDLIYGQSWGVPGANSTTGVYIVDAGGKNPFEQYKRSGSVQLAPEEVLFTAKDADVWLLKYVQDQAPTLAQLGRDNQIYTKFKAYQTGNVYGCDTNKSSYFDDASFHPHWILSELVSIFHPELEIANNNHNYYNKLAR